MRQRIESIGSTFLEGYHAGLRHEGAELVAVLERSEPDLRGFAYEGAAMGLGLLDRLTPWHRGRVRNFTDGPGGDHVYMIHVALGWVMARLPWSMTQTLNSLDPLLRWLVWDGYGFHEGFFHWPKYLQGLPHPRPVSGYATRAFDQGLGRSLWFVDGFDPVRLWETVAGFPVSRRSDLWSGIGLACVYAGDRGEGSLGRLREAAGEFLPHLAQGAAFGAKARHRAGNPTAYTDLACRVICGLASEDASAVTDEALENLPAGGEEPAFEIWRRRIQRRFGQGKELSR